MTRFMQPRYFEQEQLEAMEKTLARLKVGDDEGQRIFIIALEYELTEFESLPVEKAAAPAVGTADENLAGIPAAAGELLLLLQQLTEDSAEKLSARLTSADPFARQYGKKYLLALQDELERISTACDEACEEETPPAPGLSASARRFIATLAETYAECFESEPGLNGGEPFQQLLQEIIRICDLDFKVDESELKLLLDERLDSGN